MKANARPPTPAMSQADVRPRSVSPPLAHAAVRLSTPDPAPLCLPTQQAPWLASHLLKLRGDLELIAEYVEAASVKCSALRENREPARDQQLPHHVLHLQARLDALVPQIKDILRTIDRLTPPDGLVYPSPPGLSSADIISPTTSDPSARIDLP